MSDSSHDPELARRFREIALPHLDEVYTLARRLLRNAPDADDAVQECYLRALKHFHSYQGPAIRPWLFAILRNVCNAEYQRHARAPAPIVEDDRHDVAAAEPLWQEPQETPERGLLRRLDSAAISRLIDTLEQPFREALVLRDVHDLSYRQIADITGAPVGTVMSRLARAREALRKAWTAEQEMSR